MNNTVKMILVLTIIGVISGAILAFVYLIANPMIEGNRQEALKVAITELLPATKQFKEIDTNIYEASDKNKQNCGYALSLKGGGYQGNIRLMLGISPDLHMFTGIVILESSETPGLGARIDSKEFRDQFKGLLVRSPISYVKNAAPDQSKNEIQAIAGATISSRSVVKIINDGVKAWLTNKK
ncbi:MAG: RnfABCDGE type electron transport complex subunit G [bacterium]